MRGDEATRRAGEACLRFESHVRAEAQRLNEGTAGAGGVDEYIHALEVQRADGLRLYLAAEAHAHTQE